MVSIFRIALRLWEGPDGDTLETYEDGAWVDQYVFSTDLCELRWGMSFTQPIEKQPKFDLGICAPITLLFNYGLEISTDIIKLQRIQELEKA